VTDATRLDDDEVQALQAAVAPRAVRRADVRARNFSEPRRLSSKRLQHFGKLIGASLQGICNEIAAPLRSYYKLHLASVSEVNVVGLFDDIEAPCLVHCLRLQDRVAWTVWDSAAAACAVEAVITGDAVEPEARRLSRSECRVIEDVLDRIVRRVGDALGLTVGPGRVAQEPEDLLTLRDEGPDADSRRVLVHLVFDGPGGTTDMRLYLPDVDEAGPTGRGGEAALPHHLDDVHLPLSACLGSVDVPLSELLALEVGDVVPLGIEVGTPLAIFVEERACAKAAWGRYKGHLAVRIDQIDISNAELHPPAE
jgi:flagellar motor switch protein FliM